MPVFKDAKKNLSANKVEAKAFVGPLQGALSGAVTLPSFTVATLPAAADNAGMLVFCSDGAEGSPCLALSQRRSWLRIVLGAAVAAA